MLDAVMDSISHFVDTARPRDGLVLALSICIVVFAIYVGRVAVLVALWLWRRAKLPRLYWSHMGALLSVAATIFFAYVTVRNADRASAEANASQQAYAIGGYEFQHDFIRCLYDWYDGGEPQECLNAVYSDGGGTRGNWTMSLLYIEEVLTYFGAVRDAQLEFGNAYNDTISYWREDVAEDPTGLFSYYVVSEANDLAIRHSGADPRHQAACLLLEYNVENMAAQLCDKYHFAVDAAPPGFISNVVTWCPIGQGFRDPTPEVACDGM